MALSIQKFAPSVSACAHQPYQFIDLWFGQLTTHFRQTARGLLPHVFTGVSEFSNYLFNSASFNSLDFVRYLGLGLFDVCFLPLCLAHSPINLLGSVG